MKKLTKITTLLITLAALAPLSAQGATTTETANVKSAMTHLFLWSDDPAVMQFADVDLTAPKLAGWSLFSSGDASGAPLIAEGPAIKKGWSKFDITFNYSSAPFSFQFAAVVFDAVTSTHVINNEGNFTFNGSKLNKAVGTPLSLAQITDVNTHFNPAPAVVPIPDSIVLALSAIGFLGIYSRKSNRRVLPAETA